MELFNNFSTREKNLWSELLVDVVVGFYYYPKIIIMIIAGGEALTRGAMAELVTKTIMLAILMGIIVSAFLHAQKKPEQVDERDQVFKARGNSIGYRVLVFCVVLLMVQILVTEFMPDIADGRFASDLSGVAVANLLLMSLFFSSLAKTLIQLFSYRRGH